MARSWLPRNGDIPRFPSENLKIPGNPPGNFPARDIHFYRSPCQPNHTRGNVLKCMACREKKGTNYHGTLEVIYDR